MKAVIVFRKLPRGAFSCQRWTCHQETRKHRKIVNYLYKIKEQSRLTVSRVNDYAILIVDPKRHVVNRNGGVEHGGRKTSNWGSRDE